MKISLFNRSEKLLLEPSLKKQILTRKFDSTNRILSNGLQNSAHHEIYDWLKEKKNTLYTSRVPQNQSTIDETEILLPVSFQPFSGWIQPKFQISLPLKSFTNSVEGQRILKLYQSKENERHWRIKHDGWLWIPHFRAPPMALDEPPSPNSSRSLAIWIRDKFHEIRSQIWWIYRAKMATKQTRFWSIVLAKLKV